MRWVTLVPVSFTARCLMLNVHGLHPRHMWSLLHLRPLRQHPKLLRHEHLSGRLALHRDLHVRGRLAIKYNHARLVLRMETRLRLVMSVLLTSLRRLWRGNVHLGNLLNVTWLPSLQHPSLCLTRCSRLVS